MTNQSRLIVSKVSFMVNKYWAWLSLRGKSTRVKNNWMASLPEEEGTLRSVNGGDYVERIENSGWDLQSRIGEQFRGMNRGRIVPDFLKIEIFYKWKWWNWLLRSISNYNSCTRTYTEKCLRMRFSLLVVWLRVRWEEKEKCNDPLKQDSQILFSPSQ